jgi:hypothetical protein
MSIRLYKNRKDDAFYVLFYDDVMLVWMQILLDQSNLRKLIKKHELNLHPNVLFWRYEKPYCSLLAVIHIRRCVQILLSTAALIMVKNDFMPKYMNKNQKQIIQRKLEGYCLMA